MKLKINNKIFDNNPGLQIGIVVVKGINNKGSHPDTKTMMKNIQEHVKSNNQSETLSENSKIASWRSAYKNFGAKPKKYKSSVETLYKMTLKGITLNPINKVVDIYNFISLKHMMPVGGDDIDNVDGDIELTYAQGDENFTRLNTDEVTNPKKGEVIYKDDKELLCRRWNWSECDKTKMTQDTKNVCLVIEALPPVTTKELNDAINELAMLITEYCGGESTVQILNLEKSKITV
jgi:DNA/RNA-binding domain of Phe-tRNA-synthetase-like protein